MKCKDCKFFKVAYKPMMPYDMGLAVCEKYDLETDFTNSRKINRLECIEDKPAVSLNTNQ